jgi:asparaginyl-tRNA synthetase
MDRFNTVREIILGDMEGKSVKLRGWLHHRRSSGGILFLQLRDGTGIIQCTTRRDILPEETFRNLEKLPLESTIEIDGAVKKDTRAPKGWEVSVSQVSVFYPAHEDFPIAKKAHGPEFLLDNRHLWVRSQKMQNILRVRASLLDAARAWFKKNGYTEVQVPTLVSAAVEGGSTLFEVKYFDKKAYLSQSWQLYAEALISSLGKIYTLAPSFRAEKSRTRRHLTEYWHLEVEEPWLDLEGLIKVEEQLITEICRTVANEMSQELINLGRRPEELLKVSPPFERITYDKAVELLTEEGLPFKWGMDLGWEQEKVLTKRFDSPFFVTHFPKGTKAFYHMPDPSRPEVTLSADLLAPEGYGEITGGGQRIHDYEQLLSRIREEGMNPKDYEWYLDLRKYGTVPHSGFGMGVERIVTWICKLKHIRDSTTFPRLINRIYP